MSSVKQRYFIISVRDVVSCSFRSYHPQSIGIIFYCFHRSNNRSFYIRTGNGLIRLEKVSSSNTCISCCHSTCYITAQRYQHSVESKNRLLKRQIGRLKTLYAPSIDLVKVRSKHSATFKRKRTTKVFGLGVLVETLSHILAWHHFRPIGIMYCSSTWNYIPVPSRFISVSRITCSS